MAHVIQSDNCQDVKKKKEKEYKMQTSSWLREQDSHVIQLQ